MPLIQTTPPAFEPITLAEARLHLRLDSSMTDDDTLVTMLISAARCYAEMLTGRSFISQGWRLVLDSFPGPSLIGVPYGTPYSLPGHAILLERGSVQAVTSITYLDMSGAVQTMPPTDWVADTSGALARVTPVFGKIWPIPMPQIGSVQVNYTAGYGDTAASVPEGIRQWILLRVNTLYEHREEVEVVRGQIAPMPFVDGLLDPYRILRF